MLRTLLYNILYNGLEFMVELLHHVLPFFLSLGYLIKLVFYFSRKIIVHDIREILLKEIIHNNTYICGQ